MITDGIEKSLDALYKKIAKWVKANQKEKGYVDLQGSIKLFCYFQNYETMGVDTYVVKGIKVDKEGEIRIATEYDHLHINVPYTEEDFKNDAIWGWLSRDDDALLYEQTIYNIANYIDYDI